MRETTNYIFFFSRPLSSDPDYIYICVCVCLEIEREKRLDRQTQMRNTHDAENNDPTYVRVGLGRVRGYIVF